VRVPHSAREFLCWTRIDRRVVNWPVSIRRINRWVHFYFTQKLPERLGFGLRLTGDHWDWPALIRRFDRWVLHFNCPNPSHLTSTGELIVQIAGSTGEYICLLNWSEPCIGGLTGACLGAFAGLTGECNHMLNLIFWVDFDCAPCPSLQGWF